MLNVRNILIPTDSSACAEYAFNHAADLADRLRANLHVVEVKASGQALAAQDQDDHAPGSPDDSENAQERRVRKGHGAGSGDRYRLQLIHAEATGSSISGAITAYAAEHDVDLIVMATHGRKGLSHLINGSVAEDVVRKSHCPVLTVKNCDEGMATRRIRRILVPVDFSEQTGEALVYARELARMYGARVDLMHVIEEAVLTQVYGLETVSAAVRDVEVGTTQALEELMTSDIGSLSAGTVHVVVGPAAASIAAIVKQADIDLIVIFSHGRSGLRRILMGSVAEAVIRKAPCPVFTIKSFGKSILKVGAIATEAGLAGRPRTPQPDPTST